jgi:hypothetical protein
MTNDPNVSGSVTVPLVEWERLRGIEHRARECIRLDNVCRTITPRDPMLQGFERSVVAHILGDPTLDPYEPPVRNPEATAAALAAAAAQLTKASREVADTK